MYAVNDGLLSSVFQACGYKVLKWYFDIDCSYVLTIVDNDENVQTVRVPMGMIEAQFPTSSATPDDLLFWTEQAKELYGE